MDSDLALQQFPILLITKHDCRGKKTKTKTATESVKGKKEDVVW